MEAKPYNLRQMDMLPHIHQFVMFNNSKSLRSWPIWKSFFLQFYGGLWNFMLFEQLVDGFTYSNLASPGLIQIRPPPWQAEADTEVTLSASPASAVGQSKLTLPNIG